MSFRITGLDPKPFQHLYGQSTAELAGQNILRYTAGTTTGFPDRIEMRAAKAGETVLLLNHICQPSQSPYHASHAIFVREGADKQYSATNEVPEIMSERLLSLRGFDQAGMMHEGDVVAGVNIASLIERFFDNEHVDYIHVHNAGRGCYSGRVDRA